MTPLYRETMYRGTVYCESVTAVRLGTCQTSEVDCRLPQRRGSDTHPALFPQSPALPVQRERKQAMRPYETMIVFDTSVDAQAIQASLDRALDTIRQHGGTPGARARDWPARFEGRRP